MTTQDGYDWPTPHPVAPEPPQPMAPYFREQLAAPSYACRVCNDQGFIREHRTHRLLACMSCR